MKLLKIKIKNEENLRPARSVDSDILVPRLLFIILVLALVLFGLVMIFSASNVEALDHEDSPFSYLFKQLLFCVVGIFAAIAVWRWIPFSAWRGNFLWVCFGFFAVLMLATLIGGTDILGARRWIYIGPASFQPSEFAKIILVLIVARYYAEYRIGSISFRNCVLIAGGLSVLMLGFIFVGQSDLGSTVVCLVGILSVLYIAGFPNWIFGLLITVCILLGIGAIVVSGWRSNRLVFLDPYNDGAGGYGAGYQLIRSMYALAEGGFAGVGLGNSYEKYQYLPEAETDFIYAIVGEELGFIGCILVLAIFVAFLISGFMIVKKSQSRFAASIAGAFIIMIVFQALLNIMCVVGLAPTTGKPLPFISSGGSSLIASLVMVGFVLAASEAEAMPDEFEKRRIDFRVSGNVEENRRRRETEEELLDERIRRRVKTIAESSRNRKQRIPKAKTARPSVPKFIDNDKRKKTTSVNRSSTPKVTTSKKSIKRTIKPNKISSANTKPKTSSYKRSNTTLNKSRTNTSLKSNNQNTRKSSSISLSKMPSNNTRKGGRK